MIELIAQQTETAQAWGIIFLGIGLGLLAICVPRLRKKYDPLAGRPKKKTVRHQSAGSLHTQSRYSQQRSRR